MIKTEAGQRDWGEVEVRTRALARLERIWSKNGSNGASGSTNISTASGEERERRLFGDTLRDGYVLCQYVFLFLRPSQYADHYHRLMNKLRSSSVVRPDPREDGFVKTSNVTKFLAACASYGLPNEDLFQRDDLIQATSESLARVAKTVIALFRFVDSPPPSRSKFVSGQATTMASSPPYTQTEIPRASSSTPNLVSRPSPVCGSPPRKRWSPPSELPTLRSHSPDDNNDTVRTDPKLNSVDIYHTEDNVAEFKSILVPQLKPPPRSPLRRQRDKTCSRNISPSQNENARSSAAADSIRVSINDVSIRDSVDDGSQLNGRQSMSLSMLSDTTAVTTISSMFGGRSSNHFGTIRTMTTDLTSEAPSVSRAEGSLIAEDLAREREREPADLSRVAEETEESVSSKGHGDNSNKSEKPSFYLGKGKWPEDFMDALQQQSPRSIPTRDLFPDQEQPSPISVSSPRKLAVVGAPPGSRSPPESISPLPRRPTHRSRHSVDAPIMMPKDAAFHRDSPDSGRLVPRRHSTKPTASSRSSGILIPRTSNKNKNNVDDLFHSSDNDASLVPFPRTTSASGTPSSSHHSSTGAGESALQSERPRILRGRFQSEIEGSNKRGRPNSYDEPGTRAARSRIESMLDLGVGSGTTSASDLMSRRSHLDNSAVRMRLVVREDGKPPTHFVSLQSSLPHLRLLSPFPL